MSFMVIMPIIMVRLEISLCLMMTMKDFTICACVMPIDYISYKM